MVLGILFIVLAAVAIFGLGIKYGIATEQKVVGEALAAYHKADAATVGFINKVLGTLKSEYTRAYDEAVAEADKLEKLEKGVF